MKKTVAGILIALIFILGSCVRQTENVIQIEIPSQLCLSMLKDNYEIVDDREFGLWSLYFEKSQLNGRIKEGLYDLQIGEMRFPLNQNPLNGGILEAFLPEDLEEIAIKNAVIVMRRDGVSSCARETEALFIEKIYLEKEMANNTNLYELSLVGYLSLKNDQNEYVYHSGVLIRPTYIKTNEENVYSLQRYHNARQAAAVHTMSKALAFLKSHPTHEQLLFFENPNRVDITDLEHPREPDTRPRLRQLGEMGAITQDCVYAYNVQSEQSEIVVSLKRDNLTNEAWRQSDVFKLQLREDATVCCFEEDSAEIFISHISSEQTMNTELVKNARFIGIEPSKCVDIQVKVDSVAYTRLLTEPAAILRVATNTTVAQLKRYIESVDGSLQTYRFEDENGLLGEDDLLTNPSTITVIPAKGEAFKQSYKLTLMNNPYVRLEQVVLGETKTSWHETIQLAIDAGAASTVVPTITVYVGEYFETLNLGEKNYHMMSTAPEDELIRDKTIINAVGQNFPAIFIFGGQDNRTIVEGLSITAEFERDKISSRGDEEMSAGIAFKNATPEIRYNHIYKCGMSGVYCFYSEDDSSSRGGGYSLTEDVKIHHNLIEQNFAHDGGGIYLGGIRARVYENEIRNNHAQGKGGGIWSDETIVKNKAGELWYAVVYPGTCESTSYFERVEDTNIYSGNTVETKDKGVVEQHVWFERKEKPSENFLTYHHRGNFVQLREVYDEGLVMRLFIDEASVTEVASKVYTADMNNEIVINYEIEPDREYWITLQDLEVYVYAQSEKVGKLSECGPEKPWISSPWNGQENVECDLTLDWSDAQRALSYNLYFGSESGNLTKVKTGLADSEYAISGLAEGTTCYWKIEAIDQHGDSAFSEESCFTTIDLPDAPRIVSPVNNGSLFPNVLTFEWQAVDEAIGYNVYLGESTQTMSKVSNCQGGTTYSPSLKLNQRYYWIVETIDNAWRTARSATQTFVIESGFETGNGVADDPFLVSCVQELKNVRYYLGDDVITYFAQSVDIDLNGVQFESLGNDWQTGFKDFYNGKYDGIQHKISNLNIDKTGENNVGLFGYTSGGTITNCRVENSAVAGGESVGILSGCNSGTAILNCFCSGYATGTRYVGGLVGNNSNGWIKNCRSSVDAYVTDIGCCGSLIGKNWNGKIEFCSADGNAIGDLDNNCYQIGGLIGYGWNNSEIYQCYSTGNATGSNDVGGFIGGNSGKVIDCYSTGDAWGPQSYSAGGFTGCNNGVNNLIKNCYTIGKPHGVSQYSGAGFVNGTDSYTKIEHCYWDYDQSGVSGSGTNKGTFRRTSQMKYKQTYEGWDFDTIWGIKREDGEISYPYLRQNNDGSIPGEDRICDLGNGEENTPYRIYDEEQLANLKKCVGVEGLYFVQEDYIDLSSVENWQPIGVSTSYGFMGLYDGQDHEIQNLTVNQPGISNAGLFGAVDGGTVTNLKVVNGTVIGGQYTGGVVGYNSGTVDHVSFSGVVNGGSSTGGISGMSNATITSCNSDGEVSGTDNVGGLVGTNFGYVAKSFSTALAIGSSQAVGGFVGWNYGAMISECYSTGNATTTSQYVGGFVGNNWDSIITDSYSTGDAVAVKVGTQWFAGKKAGGFAGVNYSDAQIKRCYSIGKASGEGNVGGFIGENSACSGNPGTAADCFWDRITSGLSSSCGGKSHTTDEMKQQITYTNWDFEGEIENGMEDIWKIDAGTYPCLNNVPSLLP